MDLRDVLATPAAYKAFQSLIGGARARKVLVDRYLRARAGERVLDIGCGTAEILDAFPEVKYVGFDVSEAYVSEARRKFGERATFHVGGVSLLASLADLRFDLICAIGVLHHVPDDEVRRIFRIAETFMAPGGRIVTSDPLIYQGQHWIAHKLAKADRGRFVRPAGSYLELAQASGLEVHSEVWHDVNRIPYTAFIMRCSGAGKKAA